MAEISHYFGITDWFHKKTEELSGGQKQILNLASVMITDPKLLLLDEPTAQLDPIAAGDFLALLDRLHRELGITIVMATHHSDECAHLADRMVFLENGHAIPGSSREVLASLHQRGRSAFMPEVSYVACRLMEGENHIDAEDGSCLESMNIERRSLGIKKHEQMAKMPLEAGTAGLFLREYAETHVFDPEAAEGIASEDMKDRETVVSLQDLWFRYEKNGKDILRGFTLELKRGTVTALLGGNGCGKSTLLNLIAGITPLQKGKLKRNGKLRLIPQDPKLLFTRERVGQELELCKDPAERERLRDLCGLAGLEERHPYDLSGGEQQKMALFILLTDAPEILLLDEPAKGMDPEFVREFIGILRQLAKEGHTILLVSHSTLFCRDVADTCALMFDGSIVQEAPPREFFRENTFYTTQIRRMAGDLIPGAVAPEDILKVFGAEEKSSDNTPNNLSITGQDQIDPSDIDRPETDRSTVNKTLFEQNKPDQNKADSDRSNRSEIKGSRSDGLGKLSFSEFLIHLIPVILIPATVLFGTLVLQGKKYLFISLLVLAEALLPEVVLFEKKKHTSGEVVMLSCMIAMTVAGRLLFMPFPEVKPVTALVLITGVAFGPSFGFLCGAFGMLISNMLMGQGAWSPWQMTSMGLLGLLAGLLFHSARERFSTDGRVRMLILLCTYAFFSVILLYGGIMNPAAAVLSGIELNTETLIAYYLSGFPFDLIHAVTTVAFLLLLMLPMMKKLERVRLKYL